MALNVVFFYTDQIESIILRLNQKQGDYYLNQTVWDSICRVERGKVTNKVRFAIYARDHYRCQKCGRETKDLEIDHIFPISKGGKSNFDNLQTLCHQCNCSKSNTVERNFAVNQHTRKSSVDMRCMLCGGKLVVRLGKYGNFYGCSNYPKCKFTKKINL